jgi:hypothetical protein
MYEREDVLAAARALLPQLPSLLGDDAVGVAEELERLLRAAEAGDEVENDVLALFAQHEATREWARRFLDRRRPRAAGEKGIDDEGSMMDFAAAEGDLPEVGSGPPEVGESTIRRTPHLQAPDALPTNAGAEFRIEVWVDTMALAETEEGEEVVIEAPPNVQSVTLGVLATASTHFELVDTPFKPLLIERDVESSERVPFKLRVTDAGEPGEAGISILFVYNGRTAGSVRRSWEWDPEQSSALAIHTPEPVAPSLPVHVDAESPHLSVYVTAPVRDGSHFMCAVATPLLPGLREPGTAEEWVLPDAERVADFVSARLQAMLAATTPAARKRQLLAAGHRFWEVAPKPFTEVLGKLIAAGAAVEHIYIASEEPTMPWELIVPSFPDDTGLPADRDPLGVEFAIGRWTRGDSSSPPQRVQVSDSVVIAPTYEQKPLDATQELAFLTEHLAGSKVDEATIDSLDDYFSKHSASVVHFVCHGAAGVEDDDAIYLDANEELSAGVARTLDGFKALCRARRPLIFINSCEVGRLVPSLGGVAGFPKTFADLGARAIIAPLWPVRDTIASKVAVDLYRRALDESERTLAEIVRDIRARAFEADPFEDSYAAYCFYGDPMSPLERLPA